MAKKRKEVRVIEVDYQSLEEDILKPSCFGEKTTYYRADICGQDWYDRCINCKECLV